MRILLTGGAGFIGSCLLRTFNDCGMDEIIVVDNIEDSIKWKNLVNKRFIEYIHKTKLVERLPTLTDISMVIHLGACCATTETDFDYLYDNNVEYSKMLWKFCVERGIGFIYASTAATYGNGGAQYDDKTEIDALQPLNRYGYSKQLFDLWVQQQTERPYRVVGMKFFNVYGPNEYHKGSMASVVFHGYKQVIEEGKLKLFKSLHQEYPDGGQLRDFIYVKDVCKVIMHFVANKNIEGLFNVGTGCAETFLMLGISVFKSKGLPANIEYIDMPGHLVGQYQYFTEAKIDKLRETGYTQAFMPLAEGVYDYVGQYLNNGYMIY